jgi:hypothetical protein
LNKKIPILKNISKYIQNNTNLSSLMSYTKSKSYTKKINKQSPKIYVKCLLIKPNGHHEIVNLCFDYESKLIYSEIVNQMKNKYNCNQYTLDCVKAKYPDQTSYSVFTESANSVGHKFNPIATHILNKNHNIDTSKKPFKYYGDCYIIHFDQFGQMYDVDCNAFLFAYNKKYTKDGMEERDYFDRIFVKKESNKLYSKNENKPDCVII